MRRLCTLVFAIGVFCSAVRLEAQNIPSAYRYIETSQSVSTYAGYLWTGSADPDIGPTSVSLFGVGYTIRFTGPLSGLASVGFSPSERPVLINTGAVGEVELDEVGVADAPLILLEGGLHFRLTGPRTWNGLAPYLVATGGLVANLGDDDDFEVEEDDQFDFGPSFAVRFGAGVEYFATDRLSLRAELRDHVWRLSVPNGLLAPQVDENQWINNLGLTLGAAIHF